MLFMSASRRHHHHLGDCFPARWLTAMQAGKDVGAMADYHGGNRAAVGGLGAM